MKLLPVLLGFVGGYLMAHRDVGGKTKVVQVVNGFIDSRFDGSYLIIFDAQGGEMEKYTKLVAKGNDAVVGELPTPTKTGKTFAGWFTSASGGTQVSASDSLTADLRVYAHWS